MEYNDSAVILSEDCEKPRIKEECFNQNKITQSRNSHIQQIDTQFIKCGQISDVDTKVGIKEETWDPNITSSEIKSNPNQPRKCEDTAIIKGDDGIDIKKDHFFQDEISQIPLLQQIKTSFVECIESSDLDTKVGIKQEVLDPNAGSSDLKCYHEQSSLSLGTGTLKSADEVDIKHEPCWVEGTSTDSLNEGERSNSNQHEAAEDIPLLESSRSYTEAMYSSSAIQLQELNKTSTLSAKPSTSDVKCETKCRCNTCGKWFNSSHFKNHNSVCKGSKWRICDKNCTPSSVLKDCLIHNNKRKYMCDTCGKTFLHSGHYNEHLLVHDEKRRHKCQICEKTFKQLKALKAHLLVHDERRQYKCQICAKSFKEISVLKRHLMVHDDKRPYTCQICQKSFKQLGNFKSHLLVHDDKRQYKCQICDKNFKWLRCLKTHLVLHDDKRLYKCQICEKRFKQLSHLKAHVLVHDSKRQFKCEICSKGFKRLDVLKLHLVIHGDTRQYKCQICEKSFKQSPHLKTHLMVHDNKRQYQCQICEKSFKTLPHLKRHLMVHDSKRQYQCQICEKSFKQSPHLKTHLMVHDNKRQYQCQICEKSFKRLPHLKRHLMAHDNKQ